MQGIFLNVNDITLVLILLQKCRKMRNPGNEVEGESWCPSREISFACKLSSFSYEGECSRPHFAREV